MDDETGGESSGDALLQGPCKAEERDRDLYQKVGDLRKCWARAGQNKQPLREAVSEMIRNQSSSDDEAESLLVDIWPVHKFKVGDAVMAIYTRSIYPAVIQEIREDGTYLILWDDRSPDHREKEEWMLAPYFVKEYVDALEARVSGWDSQRRVNGPVLPSWCVDENSVSSSARFVVGPTIPWLRAAGGLNFVSQLAIVAAVVALSEGDSAYPTWIWALILPSLAVKLLTEWKALRFFLFPYVLSVQNAELKSFKIAGKELSFMVWFVFSIKCSLLLTADLCTDSLFTASALASSKYDEMEMLWQSSFKTAVLKFLHIPCPPLRAVILSAFILSLLQMVIPLLTLIRREEIFGERAVNVKGRAGKGTCLLGEVQVNDTLFLALAEPAALATVQVLATSAAHAEMKNLPEPKNGTGPAEDIQRVLCLAQQTRNRLFLSYIGENCVQLYIQSVVFMMHRFLSKHRGVSGDEWLAEMQQLVSISVSILMTLAKLSEAVTFFSVAKDAESKRGRKRYSKSDEQKLDHQNLDIIARSVWIIKAGCAIMALSLVLTGFKLVGAYFCESSYWNVSSLFSPSLGCLDPAKLEAVLS